MLPEYNHPFIDYKQMSANLTAKGMAGDAAVIERRLEDVGYQRLSAYWKPFTDNAGKINISIDEVWNIYCFDRAVRRCLLDAIERVEVAFRNKLVHLFASNYGPFEYSRLDHFAANTDFKGWSQWLNKIAASCKRSKHDLVTEYKSKYSNTNVLPLWIACELMDFGASVRFFEFVEKKIKQEVSRYMNVVSPEVLLSWMKLLNDIRNACAHHNRVWNKGWPKQPRFPKNQWEWFAIYDVDACSWIPDNTNRTPSFNQSKTGVALTICHYLLKQVASTSQWKERVFQLFEEPRFANIPLAWMGLPKDWRTHPFWS